MIVGKRYNPRVLWAALLVIVLSLAYLGLGHGQGIRPRVVLLQSPVENEKGRASLLGSCLPTI